MRSKFQVNKKIVSILFNIHARCAVISVAADLQSDAKYYKDFQSVYDNTYLITFREIPQDHSNQPSAFTPQ